MSTDPTAVAMSADAAFKAVDLDASGNVDASELVIAFKHLGIQLTLQEVTAVMETVDHNASGLIDQEEFEILFSSMNSDNGSGECVLCHGKGHNNKKAVLDTPHRQLKPLLQLRDWLDHCKIRELDLSGNCLRSGGARDVVQIALRCRRIIYTHISLCLCTYTLNYVYKYVHI